MSNQSVLIFDIETSPIVSYTWGLFDQNIGLNQIKEDWYILAWSAKWLGESASKVMYMDNRYAKDISNDKLLVTALSTLINQADVVITQNGDAFDIKKLNARAIINRLPPIKPCRSTDILKEGRKVFKFTSHKLEYVTNVLNDKYKKLKHSKYPGFDLWKAILRGDKKAWVEMEKYCIHDVLSTEEAFQKIQGWIKTYSTNDTAIQACKCGSKALERRGYRMTKDGKYQTYRCQECGKWLRDGINLLIKGQRKLMLRESR